MRLFSLSLWACISLIQPRLLMFTLLYLRNLQDMYVLTIIQNIAKKKKCFFNYSFFLARFFPVDQSFFSQAKSLFPKLSKSIFKLIGNNEFGKSLNFP